MGLAVWDADPSFPEIQTGVTEDEHWRWKLKDNIVRLEAHALIEGIERLAVSTFGTFIRQLFLVDNMIYLFFARARCRGYRLLKLVRRFQAFCLSRCTITDVRWIPSERNSADRPSRFFDNSDEKHGRGVGVVGSSPIAVPRRVRVHTSADHGNIFLNWA